MDRGAWQAAVHGITKVGHDLATKPLLSFNSLKVALCHFVISLQQVCFHSKLINMLLLSFTYFVPQYTKETHGRYKIQKLLRQ